MQHIASGKGILRRCAAMQEYNNPTQAEANAFAVLNDYIWSPVATQVAGMKVANPNCDFGPYAKGIMYQGNTSGNALPTDFPEDWYTHDTVPFAKANRVNSTFGTTIWIMNPQSTSSWKDTSGEAGVVNATYNGFSDFHKHWLVNRIKTHAEYTNTFADSMGTQSMNKQLDPVSHNLETTTTWFAKLKTFMNTVQTYIHAQGFEVHPNGLVTNAGTYEYGDGGFLENALRQPTDPTLAAFSSTTLQTKFNTHGQRLMDTQSAGKAAWAQTEITGGGMTAGSAAVHLWEEYVAAAYYILDIGKLYWDLNCFNDVTTDHGSSWSRNLKTPMDDTPPTSPADLLLKAGTSGNLYGRRYLRGFALLNTSSAAISYTLPRTDYKKASDDSSQAASVSVPARSGMVLYALTDDPAASGGGGGGTTGHCFFCARSVPDGTGPNLGTKPETDFTNTVVKRETLIGRKYEGCLFFDSGAAPGAGSYIDTCVAGGRFPIIKWAGTGDEISTILNGASDANLHSWAVKLRAIAKQSGVGPIFVYNQEYNLNILASQATDFINAFRRVYWLMNGTAADIAAYNSGTDSFGNARGTGAVNITQAAANPGTGLDTNVEMGWCPNHLPQAGGPTYAASYPGDNYVYWACPDMYNKNPTTQLFDDLLAQSDTPNINFYDAYKGRHAANGRKVRLGMFETGCRNLNDPQITGGTQPFSFSTWIDDVRNKIKTLYPEFELWNYWDCWAAQGDWRFTSTPTVAGGGAGNMVQDLNPASNQGLASYIAMGADPYFAYGGTGGGTPPTPVTFFDMDFGVNTPSVSPFGFDSIPNGVGSGAILEVITGSGGTATARQSGAGVRGTTVSNAVYVAEKTAGVTKPGYASIGIKWYKLQPTNWNTYDTTAFSGLDALIDYAAAEKAAGRPFGIGLRIFCGADAPVGGRDIDGTALPSWMVGGPNANNNNKATDYMIWASNDGGSRLSHVPIFWNPDFTYNDAYLYHYANLMSWLNTYLSQTTAGGNRRGDYVLHVPVAAATEVGTEMPLGMGTGAASFNPTVVINGVTYGNGSNGAPAITDIGPVNRASSKNHMPATVAADTQTAQDTWLANWYHNMSTATVGGSIAPGDGAWMRSIAIHMAQANFDSSIAYGLIFSDGYTRAKDILTRSAGYLKTKLWTGQTNGRVWPPGGDFSQPVSTWTYRNWSAQAADIFDLALSLVAPAYPLIFMQTANAVGYGGSRGMPPSDFIQTATDFMNTYKAQFVETYATVWTDPTYGAANVSFTNGTLIPALAANAQAAASGGAPRGELHIKQVSTVATGPVGRRTIPAGNSDVWYRFVLDDFTTPSVIETVLLSQPSSGSNNGDLSVRINTSKQLVVRWNASSAADWTDTVALVKGDVIDVRHFLNGVASGYGIYVNDLFRHNNFALVAPAGANVSFVNLGMPNAANMEVWFYRFGAANARLGPPPTSQQPTNTDSPVVTISNPANGTVYTSAQNVQVSASATDLDGISKMEAQLDGGAWQQMTLQGSAYVVTFSLTGTAGTAQAHVIAVRATDAFADTTKRNQSTATITVTVNIPGVDTTKPVINVTSPSAVSTVVANTTTTQVISGTVTDDVGVTTFTINGTPVVVGGGGLFTTTLPLVVGSNVFTLIAKDAAGNTQTATYTVQRQDVPSVSAPVLTVNSPTNGAVYPPDTTLVTLSGTVSDSDGTIAALTYTYDGSSATPISFAAGAFSRSIPVTQGQHQITVVAVDNSGLTASQTINISVASSTPPGQGGGVGFNISLDFGKGQVLVRV